MMLCSMLYKEVILLCFLPILVLAKVLLHILFPGIITFAKSCCLVSGFSLQVFIFFYFNPIPADAYYNIGRTDQYYNMRYNLH